MSRFSRWLPVALALFTLACVAPFCGSASSSRSAKVSELQNQVEARNQAEEAWVAATDGQQIEAGGGVKTGQESKVRVDTSDGSIVRIGPETAFELTELSGTETDPVIRLKVESGKIWIVVTKALGGGSLEVETPVGVATVRGSMMSVDQTSSGGAAITCLEGACLLSNSVGATDLKPGEQSDIPSAGQAPTNARPMSRNQLEEWLQNVPEAQTAAQPFVSQIALGDTEKAGPPQLAFDGQGTLHLLWESTALRPGGDYVQIQKPGGGVWSAATNLTEGFDIIFVNNHTLLPQADGAMCAYWTGAAVSTDSGTIGMHRRCQVNGLWAPREQVLPSPGSSRDYSLALAPEGSLKEAHIVGSGAVAFGEMALADDVLAAATKLAIDAAGGYHVVWARLNDPFSIEYRYSSDGGGTWGAVERLSTDNSISDGLSTGMVADTKGNVQLIWSGHDAAFGSGIFYRQWTPSQGWGAITRLSTGENSGAFPDLAADNEGRARVVWGRFDGVWYTKQNAAGSWTEPTAISEAANDTTLGYPQIAVDAEGLSHVVWASNEKIFYTTTP